jgi:hypothetical protein
MQVSAGQDGIQRLLAAEQEAQKIVAKARKGTKIWCCVVSLAETVSVPCYIHALLCR